MKSKALNFIAWTASFTAVIELLLSQPAVKMTRLSAIETTGISFFAFIISGLVTIFAVTRMKDNPFALLFAVLITLVTAFAATWYLRLLFSDEIFFRNLYYVLNRQTQKYEMLSLNARIFASIPLGVIMLGAVVYYISSVVILIAGFIAIVKGQIEKIS